MSQKKRYDVKNGCQDEWNKCKIKEWRLVLCILNFKAFNYFPESK